MMLLVAKMIIFMIKINGLYLLMKGNNRELLKIYRHLTTRSLEPSITDHACNVNMRPYFQGRGGQLFGLYRLALYLSLTFLEMLKMQQYNEASTLTPSNEQMRELTLDEVQMVAGGDAAATRGPSTGLCGQNSWGEYSSPNITMICT